MCPTAKLDSVYNLVQVLQYVLEVTFRKELIRKKLWLSLLVALSKHTNAFQLLGAKSIISLNR